MTTTERDLIVGLRAEIAALDPIRPCDRIALRSGLGGGAISGGPVGRDTATARLIVRLGPEAVGTDSAFAWSGAADHCRTAYLRGVFLGRGSLSVAGGRTHLEFVLDPGDAGRLAGQLAEAGLPAGIRVRRGRGVVTWKSADIVSTFLRRIGGGGALLELEARRVARTVRGDLNRVLNAESANLTRSVEASARQLEAIGELEADGRLGRQPGIVRVVAAARRETPEATFGELAERLGLHRSAVQRSLARLERLARSDALA